MTKKFLINLILITLIAILIAWLVFVFFKNKNTNQLILPSSFFPIIGNNDDLTTKDNQNQINKTNNNSVTDDLIQLYPLEDLIVQDFIIKLVNDKLYLFILSKTNGNVYTYDFLTKTNQRLLNQTIQNPLEFEVFSKSDNSALIYVKNNKSNLKTYTKFDVLSLINPPENIKGLDLPIYIKNIMEIANAYHWQEDRQDSSWFYVAPDILSVIDRQLILNSNYSNWNYLPTKNKVFLNQKPISNTETLAYVVQNNNLRKIISGPGLTINPSPDGNYILYSTNFNKTTSTYLKNISTNQTIKLPISTVSDKCGWSNYNDSFYCAISSNNNLDVTDWYQGKDKFTDNNIVGFTIDNLKKIIPITKLPNNFDVDSLIVSPKDDYLVFKNKNTDQVWIFDLIF